MPHSEVLTFTDAYDYQRAQRATTVEMVVTGAGNYRGDIKRFDLDKLQMQRNSCNLPFVARASFYTDRVMFLFLTQNEPPMGVLGSELHPGDMGIISIGDEFHVRTSAESWWATMMLSPSDLAAAGRALLGRDILAPNATQFTRPAPHLMARLLKLHQAASDLATTAPDIFAHPEVSKAFEQALIPALVACLSDETTEPPARGRGDGTRIMRKFEELIEAKPDSPLYLTEICDNLGVSSRTLRTHCQEHLGMAPHRYLWLRRMTLARRQLVRAEQGTTTVTDIATGCGFGELGRFSVQYHTLFGETPSETLRRSAA